MPTTSESVFTHHEPCPSCGSIDNLARYSDGHGFCFGCKHYETAEGKRTKVYRRKRMASEEHLELMGYQDLPSRKLTEETCRKWDYQVGKYKGKAVQVATYRQDGDVVGRKLRYRDKKFRWIGAKGFPLFGQHLWGQGGKKLVVTEGEIDAMSVSQAQQHKWPVVSVPHGAQSAKNAFEANIEWLESYSEVILMFDQDEAGWAAVEEVAPILTPGKTKVARLDAKDPNELIQAGRSQDIIQAMWNAKTYRPDGIIAGSDTKGMIEQIFNVESIPYPWEHVSKLTYGIRPQEIVLVTAGSGIGKSSLCREIAYYLFHERQEKVGYIGLEEAVAQTGRFFMSLQCGLPLHLQPESLQGEDFDRVWDEVLNNDRIYLYDHWGSVDSENLLNRMNFMVKGLGCKYIFLDHVSIMISGNAGGDERRMIDNAMTNFRSWAERADACLFIVSHLRKPQSNSKPFEEGGKISLSDLRGSGALYQLADVVLGLERDQQDEENKNRTQIRVLKNRFAGITGVAGSLFYSPDTGRMTEYDDTTGIFGPGDAETQAPVEGAEFKSTGTGALPEY